MTRREQDGPGLFDVPELAPLPNARRAEAGLHAAVVAAAREKLVRDVDAGLVAGALIAARALDGAETIRDPKDRAYAVTALLPPYQKALAGLGLPLETGPVGTPRIPIPADDAPGTATAAPSWLGDAFGPS